MKALVVGDHCTDVFVYGHSHRLSPEVPCPVLDYSHREEYPGMAGNVTRNLRDLGFEVGEVAPTVDVKKVRYVDIDSGYQFLRLDTPQECFPWKGQEEFTRYDVIILADYGKGFLEERKIEEVSKFADNGIPVFIDTKMTDLSGISKGAVVKVNRKEYEKIYGEWNCHLIVTLGKEGAAYMRRPNGSTKFYDGFEVPVFDLMGAGDTFMAVLVWAMIMKGFPIEEAIEWANLGASLVVQKKGTATITEKELHKEWPAIP